VTISLFFSPHRKPSMGQRDLARRSFFPPSSKKAPLRKCFLLLLPSLLKVPFHRRFPFSSHLRPPLVQRLQLIPWSSPPCIQVFRPLPTPNLFLLSASPLRTMTRDARFSSLSMLFFGFCPVARLVIETFLSVLRCFPVFFFPLESLWATEPPFRSPLKSLSQRPFLTSRLPSPPWHCMTPPVLRFFPPSFPLLNLLLSFHKGYIRATFLCLFFLLPFFCLKHKAPSPFLLN